MQSATNLLIKNVAFVTSLIYSQPGAELRIQLEKLHLDDKCQVRVTGVYGTTKLRYSTPKQQVYEGKGHVAQGGLLFLTCCMLTIKTLYLLVL